MAMWAGGIGCGCILPRSTAKRNQGTQGAWQDYEGGQRRMHPGLWKRFLIKNAMREKPMTLQPDAGKQTAARLATG
jgi:hypothetical protein